MEIMSCSVWMVLMIINYFYKKKIGCLGFRTFIVLLVYSCIVFFIKEPWITTTLHFGPPLLQPKKTVTHVAQVGTGVFLDQTLQINWHFEYIWMDLIEQKDHLWCLWDISECQQKQLVKGKALIIYFCVLCHAWRVEIWWAVFVCLGAILR